MASLVPQSIVPQPIVPPRYEPEAARIEPDTARILHQAPIETPNETSRQLVPLRPAKTVDQNNSDVTGTLQPLDTAPKPALDGSLAIEFPVETAPVVRPQQPVRRVRHVRRPAKIPVGQQSKFSQSPYGNQQAGQPPTITTNNDFSGGPQAGRPAPKARTTFAHQVEGSAPGTLNPPQNQSQDPYASWQGQTSQGQTDQGQARQLQTRQAQATVAKTKARPQPAQKRFPAAQTPVPPPDVNAH